MKTCQHEMVSTEYFNQPIGHCMECNYTVVKNGGGNWVKL